VRDALLVVEVVSPGSGYTDTVDKLAEYAYEGIPVYLVVHLDGGFYVQMIQEYRLDWASRTYRLASTHVDELVLEDPFPAIVAFAELDG
jgi:Uma2 family endonuclease